MGTITFDTLKYAENLKAAGFEEKQARALAEAQKEALAETFEMKGRQSATKSDVAELLPKIERTRKDIATTKSGTIKWVAGLLITQSVLIAGIVKLLTR